MRNNIFDVLTAVLVLLTVGPGVLKLCGVRQMRDAAAHLDQPWPRFRVIGLLEVLAAVGLLIGLMWPLLGVSAAAGVAALTLGALWVHARAGDKIGAMAPAAVTFVAALGYLITAAGRF